MATMTAYRVRHWHKHFENNRTKELKNLSWVPFPNKHDGDGYTELLDHENGAAHFGCWCVLVQVASKCDPRGTLLRDTGKPHTSHSLARMSRIPAGLLEEAIARLIQLQWLECFEVDIGTIPQEGATLAPQEGAVFQKGREGKEGKDRTAPPCDAQPPPLPPAETQEVEIHWRQFAARYRGHPPVNRKQFGERLLTYLAAGGTSDAIREWIASHTLSPSIKPWDLFQDGRSEAEKQEAAERRKAAEIRRKDEEWKRKRQQATHASSAAQA